MSVTSVDKDPEALTLTLVAQLDAPIDRVWELWADPRKLERWWGPPTHPATFKEHDLSPGGEATYFMTAPDGQEFHGWWRIQTVDPPDSLELTDGFADQEGRPAADMPTTNMRMQLAEQDGGTRMELRSTFQSKEQMQQVLDMGAAEGMEQAVDQMDGILAG